MHSQRLAIIMIAGIGMLTLLMPWVNGPLPGGMNTLKQDAWIIPALFAIPILLCLARDRKMPLVGIKFFAAIVPVVFVALYAISKILNFRSIFDNFVQPSLSGLIDAPVSIGFGLYLLVVAALVLPVVAWKMK